VPGFRFNFAVRTSFLAAGFLLCCTFSIAAQAAMPEASTPAPTHEVTDELGRTILVPVTPSRIVSLAPSLTETLYALGAENRLMGDTIYCDYPPDAQKKPKVGGAIDPNLEKIVALHPDLVLVTKGFNRPDTVRALERLGIPSYATDPHNVDEIISSTQKLAALLNIEAAGKTLAEELQQRLAALQSKLNNVPPKRVLFIVWTDPLISIGKHTFIADALRRAGAVSIVDSAQDWPQISLEEVVHLQPDFLVFAANHSEGATRDFEMLSVRQGWRILDAVRNRRYAVISDAVNRPAPRIVSAIEDLAHQLHPEAFQETPGPENSPPPNSGEPQNSQPKPVPKSSAASACSLESTCAH
jgi:ABC-type Fe3+-hydroxamate transport system substrate-binding protein